MLERALFIKSPFMEGFKKLKEHNYNIIIIQ